MITFRQKQYNSNPEKNPASYDNSSSVIINSGGTGTNSGVRGSNSQISAAQLQTQALNAQQEGMRQKTLQDMNLNRIRQSKYKGIQDRADSMRARQVTAMNQAKKQISVAGIQNARESERKKNTQNTSVYKLPTTRNTPISSNNRTQIRK